MSPTVILQQKDLVETKGLPYRKVFNDLEQLSSDLHLKMLSKSKTEEEKSNELEKQLAFLPKVAYLEESGEYYA